MQSRTEKKNGNKKIIHGKGLTMTMAFSFFSSFSNFKVSIKVPYATLML